MNLADLIAECPAEWQWQTDHIVLDNGAGDTVWMHTHLGPSLAWCVWTKGDSDVGWNTHAGQWMNREPGTRGLSGMWHKPVMTYTSAVRAREGHLEACFAWDRQAREDQEESDAI